MAAKQLFKIIFYNQGKIYEIFARKVIQRDMLGFVEIEDLVFDVNSKLVVDPSEERLREEFAEVTRSYIPLHAVIRIDEVKKQGQSKISALKDSGSSNVTAFPSSIHIPKGRDK